MPYATSVIASCYRGLRYTAFRKCPRLLVEVAPELVEARSTSSVIHCVFSSFSFKSGNKSIFSKHFYAVKLIPRTACIKFSVTLNLAIGIIVFLIFEKKSKKLPSACKRVLIINFSSNHLTYQSSITWSYSFKTKPLIYWLTGAGDFEVKVWNLHTGQLASKMGGLMAPVTCMTLTTNDAFLIVSCEDETLRVFSLCSSVELHELHGLFISKTCSLIKPNTVGS